MAKRKKLGRRPGLKAALDVRCSEQQVDLERGSDAGSTAELEQFVVQSTPDMNNREEVDSLKSARRSWAEEVENLQSASQHHWQQFTGGKALNYDAKLSYTEPVVREGRKIAHIDLEEVKLEEESWKSSVICVVLGANVPALVFEGFIRRIWGHLGIVQVARMTKGLTMVKFNDVATRDEVLENAMIQFDRKPVIVRPWSADLNMIRMVKSVPLWIRLPNLGLQYWGKKTLSVLVSSVGNPILIDKYTKDRTRVQFARVLVEMEITDKPERTFWFVNEYGQLVEQEIEYEWLPVKCKHYGGFGHIMAECKKVEKPKEAAKEKVSHQTAESNKMEGRILLLWRKKFVNIEVIEDSKQHVHCVIKMIGQKKDFFASFVYGANTVEGRRDLWSALSKTNVTKAWVILGDFNAVFNHDDRQGGNAVSASELEDSNDWVVKSSVGPMKRTGSNFTWTNKQNSRIFSRIDHVSIMRIGLMTSRTLQLTSLGRLARIIVFV
uniref:DUF4283 domain-containing protein n=1 Tax=Cannabis sativa TaxID=3483 RepID=A0A803PQB7_CANSA